MTLRPARRYTRTIALVRSFLHPQHRAGAAIRRVGVGRGRFRELLTQVAFDAAPEAFALLDAPTGEVGKAVIRCR